MITILLQKILAALTQLLGDIKTKLNTIKDNLDNLIVVATAAGPIASFTTTITKPFITLSVEIKPKQASGTPTPSNPLPISGTDTVIVTQTKKNLVFSKIDATVDASGVVISSSNYYKLCIAKVAQGQTYTVTTSDTQLVCGFFTDIPSIGDTTYNNSRTIQASKTFTAPITGYVGFRAIYDGDYQCEVGNQATAYEAYSATTKTVSLPETVYGGEVDCIGGSGESNYSSVDLGSLTWLDTSTPNVFYATVNGMKAGYNPICYCSIYKGYSGYYTGLSNNEIAKNSSYRYIYIKDTRFASASEIGNNLDGIMLYYPVDTPTPITLANPIELTALAGVNNIFSDSGDVTVEYLKLYKED